MHTDADLIPICAETSKRHLSSSDTDLIELALNTVYALDKLLRLLRNHKTKHDLAELRLRWESRLCQCWEDLVPLRQDVAAFELKCNRRSVAAVEKSGDGSCDTMYSTGSDSRILQHKRSLSSSRMAAEALQLEMSRLALRISSFNGEKVLPTGKLLDLLIDQTQIPEQLIDEQEKLEEAVPSIAELEEKVSRLTIMLQYDLASAAEGRKAEVASAGSPITTLTPSDPKLLMSLQASAWLSESRETDQKAANNNMNAIGSSVTPAKSAEQSRRSGAAAQLSARLNGSPRPNRYRPNPRDQLDVAIGKTINRMAFRVSVVPVDASTSVQGCEKSDYVDLSGRYWVGYPAPRLCFCRILRSNTVMVRVGGGWQELSDFITQHYAHLMDSSDVIRPRTPVMSSSAPRDAPWLRSASGPASPSASALVRLKETHKPHMTPSALRVVTMPISSSPALCMPDTPLKTCLQSTSMRCTSVGEELAEGSLSKSGSNESVVIRDLH